MRIERKCDICGFKAIFITPYVRSELIERFDFFHGKYCSGNWKVRTRKQRLKEKLGPRLFERIEDISKFRDTNRSS